MAINFNPGAYGYGFTAPLLGLGTPTVPNQGINYGTPDYSQYYANQGYTGNVIPTSPNYDVTGSLDASTPSVNNISGTADVTGSDITGTLPNYGTPNYGVPNLNSTTPDYFNNVLKGGIYGAGALGGLGLLQTGLGLAGLNKIGQMPNYSISPELQNSYNQAQQMATQGFTPQERIAYQNDVAQQQNAARRAALDTSGGQLAGTIAGTLGSAKLDSANKFAGQDAALLRQNQQYANSVAQQIQEQKNRAAQQQIDQYNRKQQAYGGQLNAGATNVTGFLSTLGQLAPLLAL